MLSPLEAFEALELQNERFYRDYEAWYTGDFVKLKRRAKTGEFWRQTKRCTRKVHIPIAAEIASASADLLFAEPPSVLVGTAEDHTAQQRIDYILAKNRFNAKGYSAAESCSVFGDVYIKINWDIEQQAFPILNVVQATSAYAEYDFGVIKAIHFFTKSKVEGKEEKYNWICETRERGKMTTYEGGGDANAPKSFTAKEEINVPGNVFGAIHMPNITPNRDGDINHGRSDYAGVISLMDALDEAWSSWVRDVDLGKARLIVPRDYFRAEANPIQPGEYVAHFDKDDEIYVAMDVDPDRSNGTGIEKTQFDIRSEQHKATCMSLLDRIVTAAGYSPQTFGINISGSAESGTALNVRERRTYTTKAKKELYFKNALEALFRSLIEIDKGVFKQKYPKDLTISLEFKEPAQDASNVAEAIYKLDQAGAISTYEKVKRANPDWNDGQIRKEVDLIQREKGVLIDDPFEPSAAFRE